ncbi:fused phosphoenolpyruvate-protein phosphotransferase PtsP/GAF domain [Cedecea neteri]|uniref:Fused phosphoenolpyruvate-protein phosphotransferase PtsP/GAF domain n=1 Tax=Cedecea neteri TaxID=158822 RepID=A0A2X2T3N4_9ENTR|nr:fused phosphoenolpyruvate-protein phosphotransferase PtsP/GAF domain [Cedecea neteri]
MWPAVKEERFRAFLGVPIIQRRQLLGVLVVQQREHRQYDESEESFLVTLATQMAGILSQSQLAALFGPISSDAHSRAACIAWGGHC